MFQGYGEARSKRAWGGFDSYRGGHFQGGPMIPTGFWPVLAAAVIIAAFLAWHHDNTDGEGGSSV